MIFHVLSNANSLNQKYLMHGQASIGGIVSINVCSCAVGTVRCSRLDAIFRRMVQFVSKSRICVDRKYVRIFVASLELFDVLLELSVVCR